MFKNVAVIGAGGWGTALSVVLADNFSKVTLWAREKEVMQSINSEDVNKTFLPNVTLAKNIVAVNDIIDAVEHKDLIVLAVPSAYVSQTLQKIKDNISNESIIINVGKGFDPTTKKRLSVIIKENLPNNKFAVLSGPNHAEETGKKIPSATVIAAEEKETAELLQDAFMTSYFRVYTSSDIVGVELGGALKNIIALSTGILDGLSYGDNTRAALMTRGISEITRLGKAMGASSMTFAGLSGIGDLIVTCTSMHSRNRRCGIALGKGVSLKEYLSQTKMEVEGVGACRSAYHLAQKHNVRMPITSTLYRILYEGLSGKDAVKELMTGDKRHEIEDIAF